MKKCGLFKKDKASVTNASMNGYNAVRTIFRSFRKMFLRTPYETSVHRPFVDLSYVRRLVDGLVQDFFHFVRNLKVERLF